MIPNFETDDIHSFVEFLYQYRLQLETLASTHIRWYTHKNPAGCWICDLFSLVEKWEDLYYPKSPKNDMNKVIVPSIDKGELTSDSNESESG